MLERKNEKIFSQKYDAQDERLYMQYSSLGSQINLASVRLLSFDENSIFISFSIITSMQETERARKYRPYNTKQAGRYRGNLIQRFTAAAAEINNKRKRGA